MKKNLILLSFFLLFPSLLKAAKIYSGLYKPEKIGIYYDSLIEVQKEENGQVKELIEKFVLEETISIPFYFNCNENKCINIKKPYWTITILSPTTFIDDYKGLFPIIYEFVSHSNELIKEF